MKQTIQRISVLVLGWTLVIFGVIGLFVPILQGILFILLGLWVLSRESLWAQRSLHKLRLKFPKMDRRLSELQGKFRRFGWHRDNPSDQGQEDE